jgi:uncharacterized membrane protein
VTDDVTKRNLEVLEKLEKIAAAEKSGADRIAERIARFCGSMRFVWSHAVIFVAWIAWNIIPAFPKFDEFPFILLTLSVSLESIFLSSFILISQNHEMRLTERRDKFELQINLLSEQEGTKILILLGYIIKAMKIEGIDREMEELTRETHPEILLQKLEKMMKEQK